MPNPSFIIRFDNAPIIRFTEHDMQIRTAEPVERVTAKLFLFATNYLLDDIVFVLDPTGDLPHQASIAVAALNMKEARFFLTPAEQDMRDYYLRLSSPNYLERYQDIMT